MTLEPRCKNNPGLAIPLHRNPDRKACPEKAKLPFYHEWTFALSPLELSNELARENEGDF